MHRSGTSMITRALHDSGLHLIGTGAEELIDAAEDNPEGFWENKAIVACNDDLLEATGGAWDHPPALPPQAVDDPRVAHIAGASTAALLALSEHERWGFKDPRTCLTAAYWLDLEPDLRFIICVRHPLEVALSLKRRNQNSYSLGLALWERYYATVLEQVPEECRIVTHYDTFFIDPEGELARLCAFAGLEPVPPRVRTDLRHHTIGVDLVDAGASPALRSLYADLCREAGVTPPREIPADEGRVRRLVLDGAVAQRHADQRQAAIERLHEREEELRAERADAEARHRAKVRELETQVSAARRDAAARLEAVQRDTAATLEELRASLDRIDERTRATRSQLDVVAHEVSAGPVRRAVRRAGRGGRRYLLRPSKRVARTAVHQLPPPAQQTVRRGWSLLRRGIDRPGPTAKATGGRLARAARARARHLPPPAQEVLRRARAQYRRSTAAPAPTAKALVRRLPPPAQRAARRGWRVVARAQASRAQRVGAEAPRVRSTPKGAALRHWKQAYHDMVSSAWSGDLAWLVVSPGSPKEVRDARAPRATTFPDVRDGRPLADDLSHIAHLEALRFNGHQRLVLPEGSRPWFRQQAELRDHIERWYRTEVDVPGAGAVFDLSRPAQDGTNTLRSAIEELAVGNPHPSVLDWTDLDLVRELHDLAAFTPPVGQQLPYLDASVDIVVASSDRDPTEASRVASLGVVMVSPGPSGAHVESTVPLRPRLDRPVRRVLLLASLDADLNAAELVASLARGTTADLHLAPLSAAGLTEVGDHDAVVMLESRVLPLPGTIESALALALAEPDVVVAGKVLCADGRLESAGGTVFSDRSVGLIAEGSADVRAPWHEFTRPVCWAPGLLVASASVVSSVPAPPAVTDRAFQREWCASAWATGSSVVYHPTLTSVRVSGDGGEPSTPLASSAWQRVLDLRPDRPAQLSDGAWRYLVARDDVEACRG